MKRILLFLAFWAVILPVFSQRVQIDGLYYNLNSSSKTAEVTYYSDLANGNYIIGDLKIPGIISYQGSDYSVTSIGSEAFYNCKLMTTVEIPNSVTSIKNEAFFNCSGLTSVTIPNSVTSIGKSALRNCRGLQSVTIPNSVTSIGEEAFSGCSSLTSVTIPNYVTSVESYTFYGCSSLQSVTIPNSVTSIGEHTFQGCSSLTSVEIGNSVTSIGNYAFYGCSSLQSVTIPNSVTKIDNYAFNGCYAIKNLKLDDGENILELGFNLSQYPDEGRGLFYSCPLETLYLGRTLSYSSSKNEGYSPFYYIKTLKEVTIGNYVTSIGEYAFDRCIGLTSVTIPNSVTSIEFSAFGTCIGLKSVIIGNSVTEIGSNSFYDCSSLTSVEIPNSVTSIGESAFLGCRGLTSMTIPNSVNSIGNQAFNYCSAIKNLKFEDGENILELGYHSYSLSSSGKGLFYDCPLETLYLGRTLSYINNQSSGSSPFYNITTLEEVTIGNSVSSIRNSAFSGCTGLTSVAIGNSVTSIGESVFQGCSSLTSIEIPNSVTSIGRSAFSGCSSFKSIAIGNSVTSIGESAFQGCSLTSVTIPNSVTSIGKSAFYECTNLTSVKIGNGITSIGDRAFWYCPIESLNINCKTIGGWFDSNKTLTDLTIGNSVTTIESRAFASCTGLTKVEIPNSVTSIGDYAFSDCPLTQINLENPTPPSFYDAFKSFTKKATLIIPNYTMLAYLDTDWRNFFTIEEENGSKAYIDNDGVFKYQYIGSLSEAWLLQEDTYKSMTSVSIPDRVVGDLNGSDAFYKVTAIESAAFKDCSNITQLKLPANLVKIGSEAFSGCNGIQSIAIPASVNYIGENAFKGCNSLERVDISDLESWCKIDFSGSSANPLSNAKNLFLNNDTLTSLSIPASITEIKNYAFYNCSGLTNVTITNSVTSIGNSAFYGCSGLTSVEIPNSVTSIGNSAFYGCSGLTSVEIPNSVTSIGDYAFRSCSSLTSVEIPNSVKSIGTDAFANIDFENCIINDAIEALEFTGENKINTKNLYFGRTVNGPLAFAGLDSLEVSGFVESIPSNCFTNNTLTSLIINPGSGIVIEEGAFKDCKSLAEITLPEDIAEIGANAFSGTALKNITIPNGTIGTNAFASCNLDNIIIGAGVESIGEKAFDGSNALKAVYATPTTPPDAENNTFSYYEAQLYVPEEAIDIYYNNPRCWYRFSGKPLVMPENIVLEGPANITGEPGETFQLTATILPSNVTLDRVLWRSTNPAVATVDNNGLVTIHNFQDNGRFRAAGSEGYCEIIASTLYEDSPVAVVRIEALATSIDYINSDNFGSGWQNGRYDNDIYTLQGVCLKRNATQSDIDALAPGMYIIRGKKVIVK